MKVFKLLGLSSFVLAILLFSDPLSSLAAKKKKNKKKKGKNLAKYCRNWHYAHNKQVCHDWAEDHLMSLGIHNPKKLMKLHGLTKQDVMKKTKGKKSPATRSFLPPFPSFGDSTDGAEEFTSKLAKTLVGYARSIRCRWAKLSTWTCTDCNSGSKLIDAKLTGTLGGDAYMVNWDAGLNAIVVTIRATKNDQDSGFTAYLLQWLSNLDSKPLQLPYGVVHEGLYSAWNDMKPDLWAGLKSALQQYPLSTGHKGVYFVGHSRGGAIATVAALETVLSSADFGFTAPSKQVRLFTMGSPRVLSKPVVDLLESKIINRFRLTNNADIVTQFPLSQYNLDEWVEHMKYLVPTELSNEMVETEFAHYGPQISLVRATGTLFGFSGYQSSQISCGNGESKTCDESQELTLAMDRDYVTRFGVPEEYLGKLTAPLWDHAFYYDIDVNNDKCADDG